MKLPVIVFTIVSALCAVIAWLSGYDFDHRSSDVAFGFFITIYLAGFAAWFTWLNSK